MDASQTAGPARRSVVLVDDAADLRRLLALVLEAEGDFTVVGQAGDGETAIRLVADTCPDLVLLDLAMPVMDGLTALPRLRESSPDSRVVVLSGFSAATAEQQARAGGAVDYVEKGIGVPALVERLRAALV